MSRVFQYLTTCFAHAGPRIELFIVGLMGGTWWAAFHSVEVYACDPPAPFEEHILDSCAIESPRAVYAADLDGDGDQDVLSASFEDDKIAWYENLDGSGFFGPCQVITTLADGATSTFAADLDGDGDADVLSASQHDDKIAWYENLDGKGAFGPQQIITTLADEATAVFAADLDGDSDADVLSASQEDNKIGWYENLDGKGSFGPQQIITTLGNGPASVIVDDLNGDGAPDVLSSSPFAWYENLDGLGDFGPPEGIGGLTDVTSIATADVDGDGDRDVLCAAEYSVVFWYENLDGIGTFQSEEFVGGPAEGVQSVFAADLDGDGDADVLSASADDHTVAWYENLDGAGTFGTQQVITSQALGAQSVLAADLNGDGNPDVLSASRDDDTVAWHENLSDVSNFGHRQAVATLFEGPTSVFATDLDGDGDKDMLLTSAGNGKVASSLNIDGAGRFGNLQLIDAMSPDGSPVSVFAADLDNDGDQDALSAMFDEGIIAWYENLNGLGSFGPRRVITTLVFEAGSVFAADLDGDGDLDVLSASGSPDLVAWYENLDGRGSFGSQQVITTKAERARSVFAADLDADGDIDVLSASPIDNKIAWYENIDGTGSFGSQQVISTQAEGALCVFAADLDGDEDQDVLSASTSDNKVAWYENLDGSGTFGPQQVINSLALGAISVIAADLDGDRDSDVVSASILDDKIVWYENLDAEGNFGPEQAITTQMAGPRDICAADLDGNGTIDVMSTSVGDHKIAWHENRLGALDLNGDGQVNAADLALLLRSWGPAPGHPADFNSDAVVNAADLAALLGAWGPCRE